MNSLPIPSRAECQSETCSNSSIFERGEIGKAHWCFLRAAIDLEGARRQFLHRCTSRERVFCRSPYRIVVRAVLGKVGDIRAFLWFAGFLSSLFHRPFERCRFFGARSLGLLEHLLQWTPSTCRVGHFWFRCVMTGWFEKVQHQPGRTWTVDRSGQRPSIFEPRRF